LRPFDAQIAALLRREAGVGETPALRRLRRIGLLILLLIRPLVWLLVLRGRRRGACRRQPGHE
jgi:hypothetical protein